MRTSLSGKVRSFFATPLPHFFPHFPSAEGELFRFKTTRQLPLKQLK
jgi:hypothetical protein